MAELKRYPDTADLLARASTVRTRMAHLYHRGCCLSGPDFVALSQELDHLLVPLWHQLQRETAAPPPHPADLAAPPSGAPEPAGESTPLDKASNPGDDDPASSSPRFP